MWKPPTFWPFCYASMNLHADPGTPDPPFQTTAAGVGVENWAFVSLMAPVCFDSQVAKLGRYSPPPM